MYEDGHGIEHLWINDLQVKFLKLSGKTENQRHL